MTLPRSDVHYVVTEYGMAYLFGKSTTERAIALIEIAHPDFREGLMAEAKALALAPRGHRAVGSLGYAVEEERHATLRSGNEVLLRPARGGDTSAIAAPLSQDVGTRRLPALLPQAQRSLL